MQLFAPYSYIHTFFDGLQEYSVWWRVRRCHRAGGGKGIWLGGNEREERGGQGGMSRFPRRTPQEDTLLLVGPSSEKTTKTGLKNGK